MSLPSVLSNRKENAILGGIEEHLRLATETERMFSHLVKSVGEEDRNSAQSQYQQVLKLESDADAIHRKLSLQIAEGAFFGGVREDMLNLLERVDGVADAAKEAARFLMLGRIKDGDALELLRCSDMSTFLQTIDATLEALRELIEGLKVDKKSALSKVHPVEESEEAADSAKLALLESLFAETKEINPVSIIQLRDFIFAADNIADSAEDASDVVLVLVAKGYG